MKTHSCGELTIKNVGQVVKLAGWVAKNRDLGGLVFIDLRDREGITQIIIDPSNKNYNIATEARNEFVISVEGKVVERSNKNKNINTGEIEIQVSEFTILSKSETTPLIIDDETDALEDTRLKYRYLDLRRPVMQNYILTRHKITKSLRNYLDNDGFVDIETPFLSKSTPEGARDYLVPSRIHNGEFYALPQSPQIYKQLLMISGFEKYYQIVKCFRDEDLRADRQPEFTQLDVETSFLSQEDILSKTEEMFKKLFKEVLNKDIKTPFIRMDYKDAMNVYGSDKPDTRFEMKLVDCNDLFKDSGFSVFKDTIANNKSVKAINVKNLADKYSRKAIDKLTDYAKKYKAKGLAWLKYNENAFNGPIAKFFSEEEFSNLKSNLNVDNNDLLLFVADELDVVNEALGALRIHIAKENDLINKDLFNFLWVINWPMFEFDAEENRYHALHHPFTKCKDSDIKLLETDPINALADAYDIVLNGYEIGGGSLRVYDQEMQKQIFKLLGFTDEEANKQFGFLLDALKYGTPPHGGIAFGIDRISMIMTNTENIKDVIAFPKTQSARCMMADAPNAVANLQLDELGLKINE